MNINLNYNPILYDKQNFVIGSFEIFLNDSSIIYILQITLYNKYLGYPT